MRLWEEEKISSIGNVHDFFIRVNYCFNPSAPSSSTPKA